MSGGDAILLTFDRPTNRAQGSGVNLSTVTTSEIGNLLSFSTPVVGPLRGFWRRHDALELRSSPQAKPLAADPFMLDVTVTLKREGLLTVSSPAVSVPATGTSPPIKVRNCFLEGFEDHGMVAWAIESADASAYTVTVDESIVKSGQHSLRLVGGSSVNFDGLRAQLPAGARPSHVSFWLRTLARGNVGYFTLGGSSTEVWQLSPQLTVHQQSVVCEMHC